MGVNNGEKGSATTFNSSFMDREQDTDTTGKINLLNSGSAIINDVQSKINTDSGRIDTLETDVQAIEDSVGVANGIASLDSSGVLPTSQLPNLAITDTFTVASEAAMLALVCEKGDVAIRTDVSKTYILAGDDPSVLANWKELATPTDLVSSVNGQTGVVVLDTEDISEGAGLTNKYTVKHNLVATTAPTATNDSSEGYSNGSLWIDQTNNITYSLIDNTEDAAVWEKVGGSAGTGGIMPTTNYLQEANDDYTLWVPYYNGTAGEAPDGGFAAASYVSVSENTTTPLRGASSIRLSKSANDAQGEGLRSPVLTKEDADYVITLLGDVLCSANYADGDLRFYVWDITNGQAIEFTPRELLANQMPARSLQLPSSCETFYFCIHVASTNALAYDVDFELGLGKTTTASGAVITDWEEFTPTGSWVSNTSYEGKYRRVGDSAEIVVTALVSGAPTATSLSINLPSGLAIDPNKLNTQNVTYGGLLGVGQVWDSSGAAWRAQVGYATQTSVFIGTSNGVSDTRLNIISNTLPFTWASGDSVTVTFIVPIVGWSSNQTLSENDDGREVSIYANGSSDGTITASVNNIDFNTTIKDTHSAWNGTVFTAPVSDFYDFEGSVRLSAAAAILISSYIGGTIKELANQPNVTTATHKIGGRVYLLAGQTLSFRPETTVTLAASDYSHYIYINRVGSGSQQIAASEKVEAIYRDNGSQAITTTGNTLTWSDKVKDSHGFFNGVTGIGVAPRSGTLNIKGQWHTAAVNYGGGQRAYGNLYVNAVQAGAAFSSQCPVAGGATIQQVVPFNISYPINAGEQFYFQGFSEVNTTKGTNLYGNHITITIE